MSTPKRVAVVGSGTSGLAATWLLNEHSPHSVHLFESDDRPGGHANTVDWERLDGKGLKGNKSVVDTGFIVFNTVTYPNFLSFLQHPSIAIPYAPSEMSFAVSRNSGSFEWAGTSLGALFAQKENLWNGGMWRMIWDILRFNWEAVDVLRIEEAKKKGGKEGSKEEEKESVGAFLHRRGYSSAFRDNYLLPMTSAIWSTPPNTAALQFPLLTLLTFMHNHHLLQILNRPQWLTIPSGSHSYVNRIIERLPKGAWRSGTEIVGCRNESRDGGEKEVVVLCDREGNEFEYDHVIFATHADVTRGILEGGGGITKEEKEVLGGFEFGKNVAVLHADKRLMPKRRSTWSSWNYLTKSEGKNANVNSVSLTYWMNLLQSIPEAEFGQVFVTLNPPFEPKKELTAGRWNYEHPLYTEKSIKLQELLPTIQNKRGITFCGAWTKYGFHEDGFASGLRVASTYLSILPPFPLLSAERSFTPTLSTQLIGLFFTIFEPLRRLLSGPFLFLCAPIWVIVGFVLGPLERVLGVAEGMGRRMMKEGKGKGQGEERLGKAVRVLEGVRKEVKGVREGLDGKRE